MTQTYAIRTSLYCSPSSRDFELPEGKNWEDIQEWFIKWDQLNFTYDGTNWHRLDLQSETNDATDWKRPISATVYSEAEGIIEEKDL